MDEKMFLSEAGFEVLCVPADMNGCLGFRMWSRMVAYPEVSARGLIRRGMWKINVERR